MPMGAERDEEEGRGCVALALIVLAVLGIPALLVIVPLVIWYQG